MRWFLEPWPWWAGGLAIGLVVTGFTWITGKSFGVSSGLGTVWSVCAPRVPLFQRPGIAERWKLCFLLGIPLGGVAGALLQGRWEATTFMGLFDREITSHLAPKLGILFAGGALCGFGAGWAGGCTSGHSIAGIAQGSRPSMLATAGFMASAIAVAMVLYGWRRA